MKKYRVSLEQKDYGHGSARYTMIIEAENPDEAIKKALRKRHCGIEETDAKEIN